MDKIRIKLITAGLIILLVISFLTNLVLIKYAINFYKREQEIRLFPTANVYQNHLKDSVAGNTIILFGDSRIKSWSPEFQYDNYKVINMGIEGETTAEMLIRFEKDILPYNPNIVIIQAGVNDLKNIGLFPEREDEITEQCKNNIQKIITGLTNQGINVIYMSIFPVDKIPLYRRPFFKKSTSDAINYVNQYFANLEIERLYYYNSDNILTQNVKKGSSGMYKDEFHLNSYAYGRINRELQAFIINNSLN